MFYQQLQKACKNANTTVTAALKAIGIGTANGTYWKKGSMPSSENVIQLAEFLGVSTDFLLKDNEENGYIDISADEKELLSYYKELDERDKGSVLGKAEGLAEAARRKREIEAATKETPKAKITPFPESDLSGDEDDEDETEYIYLPFFDLPVSAGTGVYLDSEDTKKIRVPADETTRKSDYVLRVSGDSMEPRYYDGDMVLVRQQQSVEIGEVGIFSYNDEGYIKLFGGNRLISLNPNYKDKEITESDSFFCLGKVIGILSIEHKFR